MPKKKSHADEPVEDHSQLKVKPLTVLDADGRATEQVTPGTEWVLAGEGVATRKWDGISCWLDGPRLPHGSPPDVGFDGRWWLHYRLKAGEAAPAGFYESRWDAAAKVSVGWMPIENTEYADAHAEAVRNRCCGDWKPGTYELIGHTIAGNAEGIPTHLLMAHGMVAWVDAPRDLAALAEWLPRQRMEGVVFWREPGNPAAGVVKLDKSAVDVAVADGER
jgi:hypothetical protein